MKKLILTALFIASLTVPSVAMEKSGFSESSFVQEKQYKKIDVSQIPAETLSAIKKNYGSYTISEAYKADDGDYKLVLTKDDINTTVTFTPKGDMIKILN